MSAETEWLNGIQSKKRRRRNHWIQWACRQATTRGREPLGWRFGWRSSSRCTHLLHGPPDHSCRRGTRPSPFHSRRVRSSLPRSRRGGCCCLSRGRRRHRSQPGLCTRRRWKWRTSVCSNRCIRRCAGFRDKRRVGRCRHLVCQRCIPGETRKTIRRDKEDVLCRGTERKSFGWSVSARSLSVQAGLHEMRRRGRCWHLVYQRCIRNRSKSCSSARSKVKMWRDQEKPRGR